MIEEQFVAFLKENKLWYSQNDKKYKITFIDTGKEEIIGENGQLQIIDYQIKVCMRIFKVNEEKVCVEFTKIDGNKL